MLVSAGGWLAGEGLRRSRKPQGDEVALPPLRPAGGLRPLTSLRNRLNATSGAVRHRLLYVSIVLFQIT